MIKQRLILLIKKINDLFRVDITSSSRQREITYLRHIFLKISVKDMKLTNDAAIKLVNRKNHATAIHSCRKFDELIRYKDFNDMYITVNYLFTTC